MIDLDGLTAVVTGAGSGIGLATARNFAAAGARVFGLDLSSDPDAERAALERRQPSGRLVTADEVASAIRFLASPEQRATTGTVLAVDGGMSGLRVAAR